MQELTSVTLGAIVLGLVHISADSFSFKAQVGNAYTVGPRDQGVERSGMAGRLHRAARNYTENFVLFLAVAFLLRLEEPSSPVTIYALWGWVGARTAYLIAYASGVPWVRTICWQVAMGALLVGTISIFAS